MADIAVDAGGLFIGDQTLLPENIGQKDVFKKVFGSPMRRSQTISSGIGCIMDMDDGVIDVALCEPREIRPDGAIAEFQFYLALRSGVLTVCSVDSLISQCHQEEGDSGKVLRYEIAQGTYAVRAICSVVPSSKAEWGGRGVVDSSLESAFFAARREWVFGSLSRDDYEKVISEYDAAKRWYKLRLELAFVPVDGIPSGWEPEDPVFELKPSNADVYASLSRNIGSGGA